MSNTTKYRPIIPLHRSFIGGNPLFPEIFSLALMLFDQEFFERSRTQDILTIMSDQRPQIFEITSKFRQSYSSVIENALDSNDANDMSLRNLLYILRCQMSEERLYRPSSEVLGTGEYD